MSLGSSPGLAVGRGNSAARVGGAPQPEGLQAGEPQDAAAQLAAAMVEHGCTRLFTLMGAGNLWLIYHLRSRHQLPVHHLRHENGAVGAADGFARSTGETGWCTVTQGPGFTNTITALLTAHHGRTPLIAVVSDTSNLDPQRHPFAGGVQALPPERLLDPLGIAVVRASGSDAVARLAEAVSRARTESRPVVLVIPAGLDRLPRGNPATLTAAGSSGEVQSSRAEDLRAGAMLLRETAARFGQDTPGTAGGVGHGVLIVAGMGVVHSQAGPEVLRLAEELGCPVSTTVPACGALGEHPAVIGPFGGFSTGETERIVEDARTLLVIGASLNLFQTRKGAFLRGKHLVRIDLQPGASSALRPAPEEQGAASVVRIAADAAEGTQALLEEVRRQVQAGPDVSSRFAAAALPASEPVEDDVSRPGAMDPRVLCREFDAALPPRRRIFVDNGHFGAFPILHMKHRAPRSLIWMPDFGAVGSALGASFAGALADPEVQSVLFIGDCGLYMTVGDLETVVRERTPLIVVCMNDGAAGSEMVHMQDWGVPTAEAVFGYGDIAALAAGMGAASAVIREPGRLRQVLEGWDRGGPLVLDCRLSREVRSPIYAHA